MRVLSLFSGIGALDLGLEWAGWRIAGQCEIDPYCRAVLERHWPGLPRWEDVREVSGAAVAERCGRIDLVAGGPPCQPASVAGKRRGAADDRWLWGEFLRVVEACAPAWVLAENPLGLASLDGGNALAGILDRLGASGYQSEVLTVSAEDLGAPHPRARLWVVARQDAYANHAGRTGENRGTTGSARDEARQIASAERGGLLDGERRGAGPVGDTEGVGLRAGRTHAGAAQIAQPVDPDTHDPTLTRGWPARPGELQHEWEAPRLTRRTQPGLGGAAHGAAERVARGTARGKDARRDARGRTPATEGAPRATTATGLVRRAQLEALGNGCVPPVVCAVARAVMEAR